MPKGVYPRPPTEVLLNRHILRKGPDECWPFTGGGDRYGSFNGTSAHRWAWAFAHNNGVLPPTEVQIRHSKGCITKCCNPSHLCSGSALENTRDKYAHGTVPFGVKSGNAKLTEEQALMIVRDYTHTGSELGRMFGVSTTMVNRIKRGKAWSHLQEAPN